MPRGPKGEKRPRRCDLSIGELKRAHKANGGKGDRRP
jgi:hypothetical protein